MIGARPASFSRPCRRIDAGRRHAALRWAVRPRRFPGIRARRPLWPHSATLRHVKALRARRRMQARRRSTACECRSAAAKRGRSDAVSERRRAGGGALRCLVAHLHHRLQHSRCAETRQLQMPMWWPRATLLLHRRLARLMSIMSNRRARGSHRGMTDRRCRGS